MKIENINTTKGKNNVWHFIFKKLAMLRLIVGKYLNVIYGRGRTTVLVVGFGDTPQTVPQLTIFFVGVWFFRLGQENPPLQHLNLNPPKNIYIMTQSVSNPQLSSRRRRVINYR